MNRVCILGSINMDMVIEVDKMPQVGETILSKSIKKISGGKGANQAVAASRSRAIVYMIGKVGQDDNGKILVDDLVKENINVDHIYKDEKEPTGIAIITVDSRGDNSIIVVSGANMTINKNDIDKSEEIIRNSDIIISQFETPEDMTIMAFKKAKELDKLTILNPAPAKIIKSELLKYTDIIVPNETEAKMLTGIEINDLEDAKKAAKVFFTKGVKWVIVTLGAKGAAVISEEQGEIVPAYKVNAIDTTAAGDSFIGALSSKLDSKNLDFKSLVKAVKFGNKVSSIAVQRKGAQPSIPYLKEINEIYGDI